MKKLLFVFSIALLGSVSVNAGNPKTTDAKPNNETVAAPSESKTTTTAKTYYVVGEVDANNWEISTDPANAADCDEGSIPCQFTSTNDNLGTSVSKSDVSSGAQGIHVMETRSSL